MIYVLVYVAASLTLAAGLCGHATQPHPGPWRALRRAHTARRSPASPRPSRTPHAPTQGRTAQEQT
ncbi:hypothetical protein QFZ63_001596 [Streptomyces sp. B3I7]|nr:hypothetical protein [Streptomyces sp. B3I7]